MKVALTAKLRNGALWALVEQYGSQTALARLLGVKSSVINAWVNFRHIPKHLDTPRMREVERKLIALAGVTLADIFPADLRAERTSAGGVGFQVSLTAHAEIPVSQLTGQDQKQLAGSPFEAIDDSILQEEMRAAVERSLSLLKPRQSRILRMRFGIEPADRVMTLEEIAKIEGVSRDRIRQIEGNALTKLRMHSKARFLKPLIDPSASPSIMLRRTDGITGSHGREVLLRNIAEIEEMLDEGWIPATENDAGLLGSLLADHRARFPTVVLQENP